MAEAGLAETWRVRLELDEADVVLAVGVAPGGEELGFASAGPSRDQDAPTGWELYVVDVVVAAYGSGLAQDLVRLTVGPRPVTVWVLEDNPRALAFYAKEGFVDQGRRRLHERSGLPEMRLIRPAPVP